MWVFAKQGMYSVVQHRTNRELVLIRARVRKDLEDLRKLQPTLPQVIATPKADYPFRIVAYKQDWLCALFELGRRATYPNFKAAITDKKRHDLLLKVWGLLRELEK